MSRSISKSFRRISKLKKEELIEVLSNIYNEPAIAVDTHVSRVSKRLGIANKEDDVVKIEKKLEKKIPKDRWGKTHHQLVLFGRYHCKAIKPMCDNCKIRDICNYIKK